MEYLYGLWQSPGQNKGSRLSAPCLCLGRTDGASRFHNFFGRLTVQELGVASDVVVSYFSGDRFQQVLVINPLFSHGAGIMLEIPRGAIVADDLAREAEFFSFGTNDLTQTTLGMSRDDSGGFLPQYQELEILANNPFATIDQQGVGKLMEIARDQAHKTRPDIELGICGEHGGDPESVKFCHRIGLNYVSCSPFRIPVAQLAAAQAALEQVR
jgi:signal transduction protein with GAF and PtsI domain